MMLLASEKTGLLQCPFCGGDAVRKENLGRAWIECGKCGARSGVITTSAEYAAFEIAAERWNRRV